MVLFNMHILTTLKQHFTTTPSVAPPPYECQGCESRFGTQHQVCPVCEGYTIERTEWPHLD